MYESPARTVSAWVRPVLGWHNGAPIVLQQPALELERDDGRKIWAWLLKVEAPPGQRIKRLVLLDRPSRARVWLLGLTYRVGIRYYALLGPGESELLCELKVRVKLGDLTLELTKPSLLLVHSTKGVLEYSIIDIREPILPPEWRRVPPASEVIVEYGPKVLRTIKLESETYLAVLCLPPGSKYTSELLSKWARTLARSKDRAKWDEELSLVTLVSSLPILEAHYYDQAIDRLCKELGASWARVLPGIIIARVAVERRSKGSVQLKLALDTLIVLLGAKFYAKPTTQRALNTRASILTQVIENYVISEITKEPYCGDEEWMSLPDSVRQDLEEVLKDLGVRPHGKTSGLRYRR